MIETPFVSCLLVTHDPERFALLRRSVACFVRQTWPAKELVVCFDGPEAYGRRLADHLASFGRDDVRLHVLAPGRSFGAMRNESVARARGDFVCQWALPNTAPRSRCESPLGPPDRRSGLFEEPLGPDWTPPFPLLRRDGGA
jgi:hypothetical protein